MAKLVGVLGAQRAGKDTFGKVVIAHDKSCKLSAFGDVLKEELGWNGNDWSGPKSDRGRKLLQEYGEGKRREYSNYWIDRLHNKIKDYADCTIVTDVRYINEIEFVLKNKGDLVYIHNEKKEDEFIEDFKKTGHVHPSELQWRIWMAGHPNDYKTIPNNGSLDEYEEEIFAHSFFNNIRRFGDENQKRIREQ